MDSSFGTRLRAQRERQQLTLAAIAEATKIRLPLLERLEQDDASHWPGGIFRRSYLRSYALAIGLDPEETLREFLERYPDPTEDLSPLLISAHATTEAGIPSERPRTRLQYLIDSAIGAIPQLFQPGSQLSQPGFKEPEAAAPIKPAAPPLRTPRALEIQPVHQAVPEPTVDLPAMAHVCTRLASARTTEELGALLGDAAKVIGASGIILWMWDAKRARLWPALSFGYTRDMLGRLPPVALDADNAIAAAFRSVETRIVESGPSRTGAVVVPVITPSGCTAVLALELADGSEQEETVHALATILAAQLSVLSDAPALARSATA